MKFGRSYIYLRDRQHNPVTCVVVDTTADSPNVNYQFCTVNPKDRHKYSASLARTILDGRIAKKPLTLSLPEVPQQFFPVAMAVVTGVLSSEQAGPLTHMVARDWLANHRLAAQA